MAPNLGQLYLELSHPDEGAREMRVLVTGATGYIGGRLVPALLDAGHEVTCVSRNPESLGRAPWRRFVDVFEADLLEPGSLDAILESCDAAFYLVHSMGAGGAFEERDRVAASNFRSAADAAALDRVVYLGGLGPAKGLSPHLRSRQEVGRTLASGATPTTELRAAVIIGSGSVSFEMLRYLTEVLPMMVTPKWVRTLCQPIAIADVLSILLQAITDSSDEDHVIEIGGPESLSYEEMMRTYAEVAGLPRRVIIPVPFLSPWLSSHWVGLVTPLPASVAKPLVESLRNEVTVGDNSFAENAVASLSTYRESVERALDHSQQLEVATRWSDAAATPARPFPSDPDWAGGTTHRDVREVATDASAVDLSWSFSRIGGDTGYYALNWAWSLRGLVDSVAGGVGLRRGRRHPVELRVGESLDFWRVVQVDPGRRLILYAEMKLPGDAWLSFEVVEQDSGRTLRQTALFVPRGLLGRLYWFFLSPFHGLIFERMSRHIVSTAETRMSKESATGP